MYSASVMFFKQHVVSIFFYLMIYNLWMQLDEYYQPKKSQRCMSVNLDGCRVPLYGAGIALVKSDGSDGVPLKLDFEILSQGYLVGKLVKTKHRKHISCSLLISSRSTKEIKFKQGSCAFDWGCNIHSILQHILLTAILMISYACLVTQKIKFVLSYGSPARTNYNFESIH